ncbi:twin transmembrane helix small protein [Comamonas sp. Y33R10-2]|uniref:twin transmembrane helix small protein n=1 Tax=Comamonas sp. Y33R10-2 TaxID=2853257 RepID=UPI001C5CB631|nr:twin transmembrane helix small protein [Comamonas sp. Y33R10-2]QXZ09502.1 twin transmembrane helix small protein [Comamonas sp. Y33R10-2]
MKFVIILAFLAILASLGSALFFMMRKGDGSANTAADDAERSRKMFRALAIRVAISIVLFVCILLSAKMGWIQPTGWQPGQ